MREKHTERFVFVLVLGVLLAWITSGCGKSKAKNAERSQEDSSDSTPADQASGNVDATDKLGLAFAHYNGTGTPIDYERAALLFRELAEDGNAVAQFALGAMFQNGQGVQRNYMEAVKWYQKSAMGNCPDGQYLLGLALKEGSGVPRDRIEAFKWLQLASEGNKKYVESRDELALLLPAEMMAEGKRRAKEHHQYHGSGN